MQLVGLTLRCSILCSPPSIRHCAVPSFRCCSAALRSRGAEHCFVVLVCSAIMLGKVSETPCTSLRAFVSVGATMRALLLPWSLVDVVGCGAAHARTLALSRMKKHCHIHQHRHHHQHVCQQEQQNYNKSQKFLTPGGMKDDLGVRRGTRLEDSRLPGHNT